MWHAENAFNCELGFQMVIVPSSVDGLGNAVDMQSTKCPVLLYIITQTRLAGWFGLTELNVDFHLFVLHFIILKNISFIDFFIY